MFKWLQHRFKKRSEYSSSEYRDVGDSSDHITHGNQIEVATEAAEAKIENSSMEKDDSQTLKVDCTALTEQHFAQGSQELELSDNFQDQGCVISDIRRGTTVYSECDESSELYDQIADQSTHKVESPSQKQENGLLCETQDIHSFPKMEYKMTLETLNMNRSALPKEKEKNEMPSQVQDSGILLDSQDNDLPSKAQEILVSTSASQEDIASSFSIQGHFNVQKGEGIESKNILPNLERISTQDEELRSQASQVHLLKKNENVLEVSNVECNEKSNFGSLELSEHFNEIKESINSQSVSINKEQIFVSSPKLKGGESNTVVPISEEKLGLGCEYDFMEEKPELLNRYSASVSVKSSSSGREDLLDILEIDNQPSQYNENREMKTKHVPASSEHHLSPECWKRLTPSNNVTIKESDSAVCPHPFCLQMSCLYNQPGQLCTVLGEQYVLTHVGNTAVLVNIRVENYDNSPFGCLFLWKDDKPVVLAELPDGTDIYFDGVVMPNAAKFVALVIWQATKPLLSIEPYFNSYVFVEEMKKIVVHFASFGKKSGLVSATIGNRTHLVTFSISVVFISGKKAKKKADVVKLSKCCSQLLFANVYKFVNIDCTGKFTYSFMCSCLWSGCMPPQASKTPSFNSFMLYRKNEISYIEEKQQLHLYCDVDAELILNDNGLCLLYEREGEEIIIPCTHKEIHCGNKSIDSVAGGRVKAHIRKQINMSGKPVWSALLIQVPEMALPKVQEARTINTYGREAAAVGLCSDKVPREEIPSVKSELSGDAQMIRETTEQHTGKLSADRVPAENLQLKDLVQSCDINKFNGPEAPINVTGRNNEHDIKEALPISNTSLEISEDLTLMKAVKEKSETLPVHSRIQANHNSLSDMREDEKDPANFSISDKVGSLNQTYKVRSYTHFSESRYNHKCKEYPRVFKNCSGKLYWIPGAKKFRIYTELHGNPYEVQLGSRAQVVTDGNLVTANKNISGVPVFFDIFLDDYLPHCHHVVTSWVGEKPHKVVKSHSVTFFYDRYGVYYGSDGYNMKFIVALDNCIIPIKTAITDRVFTANGEHCNSLPLRTSVVLHLRKYVDQDTSEVQWQVRLIIVQAEQDYSVLQPVESIQHELVPTWPASHSACHQPLSNFTEDSNGNHPLENIELSNQNWMRQNCYTSVYDLPLYIKNVAGILLPKEHDKIAIFSCFCGTALWTNVRKNSFVCVGGRTVKIQDISFGTELMFDAYCYNLPKFEYTAVVIWIGSRPNQAEDEDGSMYFYNVRGTFRGVTECNVKFKVLVLLNGENQSIKCQKTEYVISPDGGIGLEKLTVGDKINVHLKQKLHPDQSVWICLFMFIEEDSSQPIEGCHMILDEEMVSETESSLLHGPTISQAYLQLENDLKKINCNSRELSCYSQTQECDHKDKYMTFYLKDCSGYIVITGNNRKTIKNSYWKCLTTILDEDQLVCLDRGSSSIVDLPVGSPVKFDALRSLEDFVFRPLMLWIDKKPSAMEGKCGEKYFYDVKGVYLDEYSEYFQLSLDLDNQKRCIWVKNSGHIYFCDGRRVLHGLKTMDNIVVHLKEENVEDDFGSKWTALVIIVIYKSKEYPLKQPNGTSQHHNIMNTEMEQLRLKSPGSDFEDDIKNWEQSKEDTKILIDRNIMASLFSVMEGKVETLSSSKYKFTYTYEGVVRTLFLPTDISLDQPSCTNSVTTFYLMTQKILAENKVPYHHPICGWFHKRMCEVYVIHSFVIDSYNKKKQLIGLTNPQDKGLGVDYFVCDTQHIFRGRTKLPIEKALYNSNVHAVVQDITPDIIAGVAVHKRILFLTTNKALSLASFNFLVCAQFDNEFDKEDVDNHSDTEVVDLEHHLPRNDLHCAQEDYHSVELEQMRTATCKDEMENAFCIGKSQIEGKFSDSPIAESHLECSRRDDIELEQKRTVTCKDETKSALCIGKSHIEGKFIDSTIEESQLERSKRDDTEETHVEDEMNQSHGDESQHIDKNALFGETLKQHIAKRSSEAIAMNYTPKYSTLAGNLYHKGSNTSIFECDEAKIINLPSDIHQLNTRTSENNNKKSYLLVQHQIDKNTKDLIYNPLAIWHVGKRCDPYILIKQKLCAFDLQNEVIGISDDQDDGFHYYSFKDSCAFTSKSKKDINAFLNLVKDKSLSFYTVVEDIPSAFISGCFVNKNILLITTSFSLALASIDTIITCNVNINKLISTDLNSELLNLLQMYEERKRSAYHCKWGYSYHLSSKTFGFEHGMKLVGGCLESCSGEYAFILCDKKNTCAVCHLSNVFYQGESITSWDDIDRKFWKNFFTIILTLGKSIMAHDRNVNALAVVAWSCSGPELLTVHGCDMHDPTVFVYNDTASVGSEAAKVLCPLNNEPPGEHSPGIFSLRWSEELPETSAEEVEALECKAGSNIFSMHDKILQSCGLKKTIGEIKYFGKYLVVCTCDLDEMVWCHLSDFYIEGAGCKSIEDVIKKKPKQKCCLIVVHSPSVIFGGKTVNLRAVIGFFKSEKKLPGIHICSDHNGVLLNSIQGEKLTIAKQIFNDIQQICEHADTCAEYLLKGLCDSKEEHLNLSADTMKTTRHTECHGVFVSVSDTDPNKGTACIHYQGKEHYVPVMRQVFLGLDLGVSLHTIIGCFLKVMIEFSKSSIRNRKFRVVMAWLNDSYRCYLPQNLTTSVQLCSPSMCCSRAIVIHHFESVFKTTIFEILLGYKISSDYENANQLFKCSQVDNMLVTCKKESIMCPNDSLDDEECPWHILVHLPSKRKLCAEVQNGVGAWKGSVRGLVVLVCDVHKVQLVDLTFVGESEKDDDTFVIWSLPPIKECSSELLCQTPMSSLSSFEETKTNQSDPAINIIQASSTPADCDPWSYRSFPVGINSTSLVKECVETSASRHMRNFDDSKSLLDFGNQPKIHSCMTKSPKEPEDLTVTSQLMTEETILTYKQFEGRDEHLSFNEIADETNEEFSDICFPKTYVGEPVQTVESEASDMKIEKGPDQYLEGGSISYVESCKFEFVNEYQGIIKNSGMTILVRNHRLYVNMLNPKEPLTELIKEEENTKVQAMVVPLLSPVICRGYTVTHKALVAWMGMKPKEVNSIMKSYQDSHGLLESVPELENPSVSTEGEQYLLKAGKRDKDQKFLEVLNDVPQTLTGCIFIDSNAIFGTLRSGTEYILFLRDLIYLKRRKIHAQCDMKKALSLKCVNAVILKLKRPINALDCQVTNIALLVWTGKMPKNIENTTKDSLDFYRKDWTVELHEVQPRKISGISAKPATTQQIEEYHDDNDTLNQSMKDMTQDFPRIPQAGDLRNVVSLEERESSICSNTGEDIEITFKDVSKFECVNGGILLVCDDFAVLKVRNKFAFVRKQDFYVGETRMISSLPFLEQLKNVHGVGAFVTEITNPVYMLQFIVTDFALLAFGGKKPRAVESILATWKEQDVKEVTLSQKTELKPKFKTEPTPCSSIKLRGNNFETQTATLYKLMTSSGILNVKNEKFEGGKAGVFFNRGHVYVDKKALPEDEPLSKYMAHLKGEPWGCVARPFPKKKQVTARKISGVKVQYIAIQVWYGKKPSKKDLQNEQMEKSTEQRSMEVAESQVCLHPKSGGKGVVKNMAVSSSRKESDIVVRNSSNPEIFKAESVAERLRRQVHSIQEDSHLENHSTGKSSVSSWSSEEKIGTPKGCITELCSLSGLLRVENGDGVYFSREKCFLYGICLKEVELSHVLPVGIDVDYELTDDGKDVKGVWVGSTSFNPSSLLSKLIEWCEAHSVPKATADLLLTDAGWMSPELEPTIDFGEEKEVVDLS